MDNEKVLNFIDSIEQERLNKIQDDDLKNSISYKYKCLDKAKNDAKEQCIAKAFEKFYMNAIPLNDEYKTAYKDDLCNDVNDFMKKRDCKSVSYYIGEAKKKGSIVASKMIDSVDKLVDETFKDKEMNISDCNADDLVFRMDDSTEKKIDIINQDLELDDISQVISDNVKSTAMSEITRAKQEKENMQKIENELANDMSLTSEAAIERELSLRGLNEKTIFQPSLFEGIMIGKTNSVSMMNESSNNSPYLYNALSDYGISDESTGTNATVEEIAFVESVREFTLLNIERALKFKSYTLNDIRSLAHEYAMS